MSERRFRIAEMRKRAGMSQQAVADRLGMKKGTYGDWERETTTLNLRDAVNLAELFDCSLDELANHPTPAKPAVSPDETQILEGYRSLDEEGRRRVRRNVANELEDLERLACKKEGDAAAG